MREIRKLSPPVPPSHSIDQIEIQPGNTESNPQNMEQLRSSNDSNISNDTEDSKHHEQVTLLFNAIKSRNKQELKELFSSDPNAINYTDSFGNTPLHYVCQQNTELDLHILDYLLQSGANINIENNDGITPIVFSIVYANYCATKKLIKAGFDISKRDSKGYNLIHVAAQNQAIFILLYLINVLHVDIDLRDKDDHTALHWGAYLGHNDVIECLYANGANINVVDKLGYTPLHWAAVKGNIKSVQLLLDLHANPAIPDHQSNFAEYLALKKGYFNVAELLQSANKNLFKNGKTSSPSTLNTDVPFLGDDITANINTYKNKLPYRSSFSTSSSSSILYFIGFNSNEKIRGFCVSAALTLLSYYLITNYELWITALALFFLIYIYNKLIGGWKKGVMGVYAAVSCSSLLLYVSTVPQSGIFVFITTMLLLINICLYLYLLISDPAVISSHPHNNFNYVLNLFENETSVPSKYCYYCNVAKPIRGKHCKECEWCIAKFHLHSSFLGKCIGYYNYRHFTQFLLVEVVGGLLFILTSSIYIISLQPEGELIRLKLFIDVIFKLSPALSLACLFKIIIVGWSACLLLAILLAALNNFTPYEIIYSKKVEYLKPFYGTRNPFDYGMVMLNLGEWWYNRSRTNYFTYYKIPDSLFFKHSNINYKIKNENNNQRNNDNSENIGFDDDEQLV